MWEGLPDASRRALAPAVRSFDPGLLPQAPAFHKMTHRRFVPTEDWLLAYSMRK
jgi:hypothetical protein